MRSACVVSNKRTFLYPLAKLALIETADSDSLPTGKSRLKGSNNVTVVRPKRKAGIKAAQKLNSQ